MRHRTIAFSAILTLGIVVLFLFISTAVTLLAHRDEAQTNRTVPPPQPEASMPHPSHGYTVFAYHTDEEPLGITSVPFGVIPESDTREKDRNPSIFKASVLNAACVATADGNGLKEEDKDPEFQKFCEGKSYLWCEGMITEHFEVNVPYDHLVQEFCKPYNLRQAEKYVRLVQGGGFPRDSSERLLYCACEGKASSPPRYEDPDHGPCSNRVNCRLLCPS